MKPSHHTNAIYLCSFWMFASLFFGMVVEPKDMDLIAINMILAFMATIYFAFLVEDKEPVIKNQFYAQLQDQESPEKQGEALSHP